MRISSHVLSTFLTLTIACVSSSFALADDGAELVVVTATRTPQPAERTGTSISVITGAELQQRQILAVPEALQETPSVSIVRNGGMGQTTTIGLRGALAGQTLVLIDGVRLNDPSVTDGTALLGDVLVNNIDRIEVLRGPQSTLYGSDAIGGVVNIITRRGGDAPFAVTASGEGGSFDTYRLNAGAHGTEGAFEYGAALNVFHTNGISAADARNGNRETDGYRNFGATENVRWHLNDWISVDLRSYYTDARSDYDGYPPPTYTFQDDGEYARNKLFSGYAGVNVALFDGKFLSRIAFITSQSNRKGFDDPSLLPVHEAYYAHGGANRFEYQGTVEVNDTNEITFGAETQRTRFKTLSGYDFPQVPTRGHDNMDSFYGQWLTTLFDRLTLTGGVRHDHDSEFGGHTSYKFTGALQVMDGTTLRANWGNAFKAPTLYELFSQYSNPIDDLLPETAHGWEAGADQTFLDGRVTASVTYFDRRTKNQIDFFSCFGVTSPACTLRAAQGGYYYNVGRARARGVELSVKGRITDTLSIDANYTNMIAKDLDSDAPLPRRPHVTASTNLNWSPEQTWSVGAGLTYVGQRFDSAGRFNRLKSHTLVALYGAYPVIDHWEIYGRIENLFDADYEPVAGYGAAGRAVYGGVRINY